jgi:hypothetical protein
MISAPVVIGEIDTLQRAAALVKSGAALHIINSLNETEGRYGIIRSAGYA